MDITRRKRKDIGAKNLNWKGDNIGYGTKHDRIRKKYGKAVFCENRENKVLNFPCTRMSSTYHWAKKSTSIYTPYKKDYYQLCASCHRIYDYTDEHKNKISKKTKENHKLGKYSRFKV